MLSQSFVPRGGRLVHGNELLGGMDVGYPRYAVRRVRDHTLGRIHALLSRQMVGLPPGWRNPSVLIKTGFDLFIGYLMLDAWIANQDRHHENWGLINLGGVVYLAPTFDHAASMGQNETDRERESRMTTKDSGYHISSYVTKARSAIYESRDSKKAMLNLELFQLAAKKNPAVARLWLDALGGIHKSSCENLFDRVPDGAITPTAKKFALSLLELNKHRLLELNL